MLGDERLELDERGDVVDGSGVLVAVVDLSGPDVGHVRDRTGPGRWSLAVGDRWAWRHRSALATAAGVALVVGIALAAWAGPVSTAPILRLTDARAGGGTAGGPELGPDGHLTVTYVARAATGARGVEVLGLDGPGLDTVAVQGSPGSLAAGGVGVVRFATTLRCADTALESATPASYSVAVRATTIGRAGVHSADSLQSLDGATTHLDVAVRNACLESYLTRRLSIVSGELTASTGSPLVDVVLRMRNDADLALNVTTLRTATTTIESDQSSRVRIAPHSTATVTTHLLVHDCALSSVPTLADLRDPVGTSASLLGTRTGLVFRVGLGAESLIASYPLPWSAGEFRTKVEATACAGHPTYVAHLLDVRGSATGDGGWVVTGTLDAVTTGIGISLEREHFTGPVLERGSQLATTDSLVPNVPWALTPVALDGGAGRLPVVWRGHACDERDLNVPTSLPVWVTASDRYVYPFEWQLDRAELVRAAEAACAAAGLRDPSTGAVVMPYVPS